MVRVGVGRRGGGISVGHTVTEWGKESGGRRTGLGAWGRGGSGIQGGGVRS